MVRLGKTDFVVGVADRDSLQQVNDSRIGSCCPENRTRHSRLTRQSQIAKASALIGCEEEGPVLDDGPADCSAKLVALELIPALVLCRLPVGGRKECTPVSRVEHGIAHELECITMKSISS